MSRQTDTIVNHLLSYGLAEQECNIYLLLIQEKALTALTISKKLNIGRTKVYRLLDTLHEKGLVKQQVGTRGFIFEPAPLENLEKLIAHKEIELQTLQAGFPALLKSLTSLRGLTMDTPECRVVYYEGKEGLEQVTWNSAKANGDLLIYEIFDMPSFLSKEFTEKALQKFVDCNTHVRQLTNRKKLSPYTKNEKFAHNYWAVRYLDPKKIAINVETLIYDDVVAMYHTDTANAFCVEIYNPLLADMQKQLFNLVWKNSQKMKIIGPGGAASL